MLLSAVQSGCFVSGHGHSSFEQAENRVRRREKGREGERRREKERERAGVGANEGGRQDEN
jgi:hypothetical protein